MKHTNKMNVMRFSKGQVSSVVIAFLLGCILSVTVYWLATNGQTHSSDTKASNEPLYWVAPMDPNFKRDKPGKSPMGMDLVPVFADELQAGSAANDGPGAVKIDPTTVQNLGVKTAPVALITPSEDIRTFGRVEYAQDLMVHIHARVEGWIEKLHVRSVGEYVEKGAPLYELYAPELVNAQEELLLAFKQNNASLIQAAQARLEALNVPNDMIKTIKQRKMVQRTIVFTAPQSGFVNSLAVQEGYYVTPSKTMLSLASLDKVWVIAQVFAQQANFVQLEQSGVIESDFIPNTQFTSEVDYIYPSLDEKTNTLQVRFSIANPKLALKPEMFVNVSIKANSSDQSSPVLAVPNQALIRTGTQNRAVLALGDGKFKSVEVSLGRAFGDYIEVSKGLQENDLIVTSAQFLIDSESSITSDFKRIDDSNEQSAMGGLHEDSDESLSAWTTASVNEVLLDEQMLNLTHGPLDAFNMMGMTMNFLVADDLDINQFKPGQELHVEIIRTPSGMYQINTVHFKDAETPNTQEHMHTEQDQNRGSAQ